MRKLIPAMYGIFDHGNVPRLGQALIEYGHGLPYYQPFNEQSMVHTAVDEIAEAGYSWTELGPYGYRPTDAARLASDLEMRGLRVSGTLAMLPLEDAGRWGFGIVEQGIYPAPFDKPLPVAKRTHAYLQEVGPG